MQIEQPNLFTYATSELSQDAIICYMLEWAKEEYKQIDEQSHFIGKKLLDSFFDKHNIKHPQYDSIIIEKQFHNIDVLCIINNTYYIIIEDKTHTSEHDNQLDRYFNLIYKKDVPSENILGIYYKSGEEYNLNLSDKYKLFSKTDILNVLNNSTKNQILLDYKRHIEILLSLTKYQNITVSEWNSIDTWISFINDLNKSISDLNMGKYITHGKGTNKGIYFNYNIQNGIGYYLRISFDFKTIDFKMENEGTDLNQELALSFYDKISHLIDKKKTFRSAKKTMTIGVKENFISVDDNDFIQFEETKLLLLSLVKQFNEAISK